MRLPHKQPLAEDQHCSPASKLFAVLIALSLTALLTSNTLFSRATRAKAPQLETGNSQTKEAAQSQPAPSIEIPDTPHRLSRSTLVCRGWFHDNHLHTQCSC